METLVFTALIVFLCLIVLSALLASAPQPQIVVVQQEPRTSDVGCLPLILIGLLVLVLLLIATG
jgi:hypothetical protein